MKAEWLVKASPQIPNLKKKLSSFKELLPLDHITLL